MRWDDDRFEAEIETPADGVIAPMGGLWSTVADLARWISFLDDGAPARDGVDDGPLRRSSRRELQTSHRYVGNRREGGVVVPMSYGYGLRISVRGGRPMVVTHSGGLPGYGSSMRWLAGVRLGVVALANVTYAPMTRLATDLLTDVESQLAVVAPPSPVTPAIDRAGRRLAELLGAWDDAVAAGLFSDNVELDDSWPRRRRAAERVVGLEAVEVAAINAGRGRVRAAGPDGAPVTIDLALAVDDDRRIQIYEIEVSAPPLTKPTGS